VSERVCVRFRLDGPIVVTSTPLYETTKALIEFHRIIDKTYLCLVGREKVSKQDRDNYQIWARFEKGSFAAHLDIVVSVVQLALPVVNFLGATTVWEYTKNAFEFLWLVLNAHANGKKIVITTGDNCIVNVLGDGTYTFPPMAPLIARDSYRHYADLVGILEKGKVEEVSITDADGPKGIRLLYANKELFGDSKRIDPEVLTLLVDIYKFDKITNTGKLRVYPLQALPAGEYSFTCSQALQLKLIRSMTLQSTRITVHQEIEVDPIVGSKVSRLIILSIGDEPGSTLYKAQTLF